MVRPPGRRSSTYTSLQRSIEEYHFKYVLLMQNCGLEEFHESCYYTGFLFLQVISEVSKAYVSNYIFQMAYTSKLKEVKRRL